MNVAEERALLLPIPQPTTWRTHGLLLRCTLFILTCVGVLAFNVLLDRLYVPRQGIVAGVLCIALAEWLIRARWFWTGVEEALWLGGIFSMISELPSSGAPEASLVLASGAAVAGARVRNPLFGAAAAILVAHYFEERFDLGVVAALAIALLAVIALLRTWQRPSNEYLFILIAIALPIFGRSASDEIWRNVTIILYVAFGGLTLFLAIRRRHHALFLAGGVAVAIAAFDSHEFVAAPAEAKLAFAGALLLVGSWLVSRALHGRTRGIVATPAKLTPFDDELEIAATVSIPRPEGESAPERGGEFGGAGATGKY
jgi:hypothetical protein